ncbi:MAG: hydroxymethylglutaryl-CoA reductase, partial [Acidimicrobiales bacterium]
MRSIPRSTVDDYTTEQASSRRDYVCEHTGVELSHLSQFSFNPSLLPGNIENFVGVAQVPIGIAGPLLVRGEHARGEFLVPLATTEGSLVASYNRGMKLARQAGGVTTTITDDAMQRAPVFGFDDARAARNFGEWVVGNFAAIKEQADASSNWARLRHIEQYSLGRFLHLRFNFTTGDAAGQNMVGKATSASCDWICEQYAGIRYFQLEGGMATDKKASALNSLTVRGKRVVAEATIPGNLLEQELGVRASQLMQGRLTANAASFLAGSNSNASHSANCIAAMFIATGQDAANVAESSTAIVHAEKTEDDGYYFSITIPSLIVATYGGGTGLPTQRECLEIMACYGDGKVRKLAEIVAATVWCGELSLGAAVLAGAWVESHERYGRNL